MVLYRYSRWDGSQDLANIHADDIMEQLADQLMAHGDISAAVRSLAQRGTNGKYGERLPGIQEMLQKLRHQRQKTLAQYNLGSIAQDAAERLQDIIHTEQQGIQRRLDEVASRLDSRDDQLSPQTASDLFQVLEEQAARSLEFLDQLPSETAGAIRHLSGYEFMDADANAKFSDLVKSLQRPILDSHIRGLLEQAQQMGALEREMLIDMLGALNSLLERRLQGVPSSDFDDFRQRYGSLFGPEPPNTLDELLASMQRQTAHLCDLLRSMTPAQRQELQDIMGAALQDPDLRGELERLRENLKALSMRGSRHRDYLFQGDDPISLSEALRTMERLQQIAEMEQQLRLTQQGGHISDVDGDLLRDLLGEEAHQDLAMLQNLADILEQAGYIRIEDRSYALTPLGARKIGQKAMQEIFVHIRKASTGAHVVQKAGPGSERQREETKRYEFGDAFDVHLQRTLMNAMQRKGVGTPVGIAAEDFEVYQAQELSQASTVLMVDLSLSMAMRGNFLAAKKVALALHNLIRTQFPRDTLHVVGFSTYARDVKSEDLPYLGWDEFDPYTNIQHGLAISQKLLSKAPDNATKQIIMISDGEPTAHVENGQLFIQYPSSPRTLQETLVEVQRCTRRGIIINTFMLDSNPYLTEFVDRMTRISKGRVFYTRPEELGRYILVDYFAGRRHRLLR